MKISRSERFCGRPDYEEKRLEPRISEQLHLHMIEKDVSRCHTLVLCVKYSARDEKTARSIFFCVTYRRIEVTRRLSHPISLDVDWPRVEKRNLSEMQI